MKTTHYHSPSLIIAACLSLSVLGGCGSKSDAQSSAQAGAAKPAADAKPGGAKPGDAKPGGGGPGAGGPPPAVPVKAAPVKVGQFTTDVSAVGTLLADEAVTLRAEIDGRVTGIHFQEGQAVSAGARLISIDASEWQAALAASSADARTKATDYERAKDLQAKGFVSQELVDRARGAMEVSRAREQQDRARLAKTTIKAPFSGVVGLRQISPGAYVKAGDTIVGIEKVSSMKLDFRVPEIFVGQVKRGQPVQLVVNAYPSEKFSGKIYAVEPTIDEKSRTVLVRAQVPNVNAKLKPGLFARVVLQLESRPNAMSIPEQAIVPKGTEAFVYKIHPDNKTELVKVELGERRPGEVEIRSGLAAGDNVVTEGAMKLGMMPPGAAVMMLPPAGSAPSAAGQPGAAPAPGAPSAGAVKKGS